jgi:hypothetical protein
LPTRWEVVADIASITGLFVSIAGLWYSVKAWRQAGAAKHAALEAREAVRRGDAAEEIHVLATLASELLASVQNEQIEAAALRSRDLVAGIHQARMRWRTSFPSPDVEPTLAGLGKDVEKISKALTKRKGEITQTERERLLSFCHKTLRILSGEAGRMAAHVDASASGR